jgi:hypothetical protein
MSDKSIAEMNYEPGEGDEFLYRGRNREMNVIFKRLNDGGSPIVMDKERPGSHGFVVSRKSLYLM